MKVPQELLIRSFKIPVEFARAETAKVPDKEEQRASALVV